MPQRPSANATADYHCVPADSVDRLITDWQATRPDLDFSALGVVLRLSRVRALLDAQLGRVFAHYGLTAPSFAVLVTLARLNDPEGVSQRRLADELGLTSGTVSVRMDRLVELGLVDRRADAYDKRNTRITLTGRGRELFERAAPAHLENERRLLSGLTESEQVLLADLLRKLLVEYEGSSPPPDAPLRLGMTLSPAHVSVAMRLAVGLPPDPGLLVREVQEDGPAARAGVRPGDVLVSAGGRELRSVASLYAAIEDAQDSGRLRLHMLRGAEHEQVVLRPARPVTGEELAPASRVAPTASDEHTV
jgi:DNA-binding MarR family transcriptional regulator